MWIFDFYLQGAKSLCVYKDFFNRLSIHFRNDMYKQEILLVGKRNPSKLQKTKSEGNESITEQSTETSFFLIQWTCSVLLLLLTA